MWPFFEEGSIVGKKQCIICEELLGDGAIVEIESIGKCHMKEKCLTKAIDMVKKRHPAFNWDRNFSIMLGPGGG